jgi:nucleotide-binding universal stress UspA family protein
VSATGASANQVARRELRGAYDAALAASDDGPHVEGVFREGNPADVLLEQSHEVDLFIAGSRGYGPLGAVLLGSTTRHPMDAAGCPMIIIPRGRGLQLGDSA